MPTLLLKADPTGIETGAARGKAAIDSLVPAASRAEAALGEIGDGAARATPPIARLANEAERVGVRAGFAAGGGVRMLGQQLSQVAQQGAVTGNYLGALAVQLPDMALGFGTVAIAASVVATVALPLVINAFGGGKTAAEQATEANEAYGDSLGVLMSDVQSSIDLQDRYAAAVRRGSAETVAALRAEAGIRAALLALDQNDLQKAQAESALRAKEALQVQADMQAKQIEILVKMADARAKAADDPTGSQTFLEQQQIQLDAITTKLNDQRDATKRIGLEHDLNSAKLAGNKAAIEAAEAALAAMASGAARIPGYLDAATGAANGFASALSVAAGYAASIQSAINGISFGNIAKAAQLAALQGGASPAAASNAGTVAQTRAQLSPIAQSGVGGNLFANQLVDQTAAGLAEQNALSAKIDAIIASQNSSGGTSGGGAASIDRTRQAFDQLMASMDPVIAAQAELAEAQETINAAQAAGVITSTEAAKAYDLAAVKFDEATDAVMNGANAWGAFQDAGASAIDALLAGTTSLKDALGDMLKEMGMAIIKANLLKHVTGGTANMSIGGLIMQGLTGGFFDAGGTIPSGTTGMVGEYGPELVTAGPGGARVTSRVDTARMMGRSQKIELHLTGEIGVKMGDDGKLTAMITRMGVESVSKAVDIARTSLFHWQGAINSSGGALP